MNYKKILMVAMATFMGVTQPILASDLYCSPKGSGDGSSASSAMSVESAIKKISAGDTIFLTAGTYSFSSTLLIESSNNGSKGKMKTMKPVKGATVVFDFSSMKVDGANRGVVLDGDYWWFYGFKIQKAGDNGMLLAGSNNVIELMEFFNNQDTGLQISRYNTSDANLASWPSNNLVKNCTSHENCDDATMENADGFAAKLTCGEGNVFDGCMSYNNSDDGWDLFAKSETGPIGVVTIKNCLAFRNGYTEDGRGYGDCDGNGFKLGGSGVGSAHVVQNCLAFENFNTGFTDNNNPKLGSIKGCTAFNNNESKKGKPNFSVYRCTNCDFDDLMSYYNSSKTSNDKYVGTYKNGVYYNSKYYYVENETSITSGAKIGSTVTLSDNDFISVTLPAVGTDFHKDWRNADGSLNTNGLAETKESSAYYTTGYHFSKASAPDPVDPDPVDPDPQTPDPQTPAFMEGDIYCSPNGTGDGTTITSPTNVLDAISRIPAGNTIYLLEGTYSFGSPIIIDETNNGQSGKYKSIRPVSGAKVVFDFSKMQVDGTNRGIILDGDYWWFYGFKIQKAGDNGMLLAGSNNVIELMEFFNNQDTGLQISRFKTGDTNLASWPSNNLVKNCTSHENCDDATMENADGFAAKLTCGEGNVFDGCMSYNNSDDGWDLFAKSETGPIGVVTIKNCLAFRNGYTEDGRGYGDCDGNGFKLGGSGVGSAHNVQNCLAFENFNTGFTDNNNPELGSLKGCTAYNNNVSGNKKPNISCYRCTHCDFDDLMSYYNANTCNDKYVGSYKNGVYYNGAYYYVESETEITNGAKIGTKLGGMTDSEFISVATPAAGTNFHEVWRNSDGSLNPKGLAETKESSQYYKLGYHMYKAIDGTSVEEVNSVPTVYVYSVDSRVSVVAEGEMTVSVWNVLGKPLSVKRGENQVDFEGLQGVVIMRIQNGGTTTTQKVLVR